MPKWLDNAVFYEIYPQSFKDSNGDGIGDFNGISEKLDYIKELGCNAIWLNPCFLSPFGDAGYDVEDFCTAAPRYGTNEDLVKLFNEVHQRGMHIILDLIPGHTSIRHKWFRESMKPEKNEYTDRYVWTDDNHEVPGKMKFLRGISQRNGCCAVNYFSIQPSLNYGFYKPEKPWQLSMDDAGPVATREAMKDVMRFWLQAGCDGFRVDMAGSLVKEDEEGQGTIKLWQNFREFLDREFPEAAIISEWGEPDKSLLGGFHMDFLLHIGSSHYNDLFHCDEPFFSKRGNGNIVDFVAKYMENYAKTNGKGLICIPSGNHDMKRIAHWLDTDEMKIVFAFLLSMPGAPFIYYGDEIGMNYLEGLVSVEGGYLRTGSRTPMQWNQGLNAGFSSAAPEKLYIPQDKSADRPDVESQIADRNSLYNEVKKLIALRMKHTPLQSNGTIEFIHSDGYPLIYKRTVAGQSILVIINPSAQTIAYNLDFAPNAIIYTVGGITSIAGSSVTVAPCSATFLQV